MKFASIIFALISATIAIAAPASFEARDVTPSVELNNIDHAAIDYLVSRGLFDEGSLGARNFLNKLRGKSSNKNKSSNKDKSSNSDNTKKKTRELLMKDVGNNDLLERYPFCDLTFCSGRTTVTYYCYPTAARKVGEIGVSNAFPFY